MKKYILIAGVNGVGKSIFYLSMPNLHNMERVNVDEILKEFGDWRKKDDVVKAGKIAVQKINKYFDEGITFNQETTLCGKSIIKNIEKAKKKGYLIELYYIGVNNVEAAKDRVRARVEHGGHGIEEKDIERRYVETFINLKIVLPKCDFAAFYDNSDTFSLVAVYKNQEMIVISDNKPTWFENFEKIACPQ